MVAVKRDDLPWDVLPPCDFRVTGSHSGTAAHLPGLRRGCVVEGTTTRKVTTEIAFNRPFARVSRRVTDGVPLAALPVYCTNGPNELVDFSPEVRRRIVEDLRAFHANPRNLTALQALALTRRELLVLLKAPLFARGRATFLLLHFSPDLAALQARLDVLDELLPAVSPDADIVRPLSATAHGIKFAKRGSSDATPHRFGGTLESGLECGNCKTPIHVIVTIDTRDPALNLASLVAGGSQSWYA